MTYRVTFVKSKKSVEVEDWLTLNLAARRARIKLPTDCCHGACGVCEVMTQQQGLVRACITLVSEDMDVEL